MPPPELLVAGLGAGLVLGTFGAGGSALATPVLALLGVPGAVAVASPLPAMLPAAAAGARRYMREGSLDREVAALAVLGGAPGTVVGALASVSLSGTTLLVLSGVLLSAVGIRTLLPDPTGHRERCEARRARRGFVLALAFAIGVLTGLLANGGGFLLVPAFVVVLGLSTSTATGTSLVTVAALAVPTVVTHAAVGHIDWTVAVVLAAGMFPGSVAGAAIGARLPAAPARRAFGVLLVSFAAWFVAVKALG